MTKEKMMRKTMTILLIAGVLFSVNPNLKAEVNETDRLISALTAENIGWRVDAARLLGEAGETIAVKALIIVLNNDENVSVRITAAVALAKIGEASALDALKDSARNDLSKTVRTVSRGAFYELKKLDEQVAAK